MLLRITFKSHKYAFENHSQECKYADENQFRLCELPDEALSLLNGGPSRACSAQWLQGVRCVLVDALFGRSNVSSLSY